MKTTGPEYVLAHPESINNEHEIVTARKRSLGQGSMFTGVCLSTGGMPGAGSAWSRGVPARGGGLVLGGLLRAECLVETPPGRPLLRAVRILLECILVFEHVGHYWSCPATFKTGSNDQKITAVGPRFGVPYYQISGSAIVKKNCWHSTMYLNFL